MTDDFATKAARIIVRGWHGVSVMNQAYDGGKDRAINAIADVIRREHGEEEWERKVDAPHSAVAIRAANKLLESGCLHDYAIDDGVDDVAAIIDDALRAALLSTPPPAQDQAGTKEGGGRMSDMDYAKKLEIARSVGLDVLSNEADGSSMRLMREGFLKNGLHDQPKVADIIQQHCAKLIAERNVYAAIVDLTRSALDTNPDVDVRKVFLALWNEMMDRRWAAHKAGLLEAPPPPAQGRAGEGREGGDVE